jgi:hypothetical protein
MLYPFFWYHEHMKRIIVPLLSAFAGVMAFALAAYLQYQRLMERVNYYERKVNRLEQDILNLRLWMTKDHP